MDYNDYTEMLKTALAGFGSAESEIKKLYSQAIEAGNAAYENTKQQLDSQLAANRNQAAVDSQISKRNMSQFLSSRGLTHSGENVQSEINENISLSNRLSNLDSEYAKAVKEALAAKNESDLSAQLTYAEQKADIAKDKANVTASIYKEFAGGNGSSASSGETDSDYYTPTTSTKDMAKNLLASTTSSGSVNSAYENSVLKLTLLKLQEENNIAPAYMQELEALLRASGYYETSVANAEAQVAANYARNRANTWRKEIYSLIKGGESIKEAAADTKEYVEDKQLGYIFTHVTSDYAFRKACELLGFDDADADAYYTRAKRGGKYTLGMYSKYILK